jgi:hypothetical protein
VLQLHDHQETGVISAQPISVQAAALAVARLALLLTAPLPQGVLRRFSDNGRKDGSEITKQQ